MHPGQRHCSDCELYGTQRLQNNSAYSNPYALNMMGFTMPSDGSVYMHLQVVTQYLKRAEQTRGHPLLCHPFSSSSSLVMTRVCCVHYSSQQAHTCKRCWYSNALPYQINYRDHTTPASYLTTSSLRGLQYLQLRSRLRQIAILCAGFPWPLGLHGVSCGRVTVCAELLPVPI